MRLEIEVEKLLEFFGANRAANIKYVAGIFSVSRAVNFITYDSTNKP